MLLTLNIKFEKKLKLLLDKESNEFEKFLLSKNYDFDFLNDNEEIEKIINEYLEQREEEHKKAKNQIALLAIMIIQNIQDNFSKALDDKYQKEKLQKIMNSLSIEQNIKEYLVKTDDIYKNTSKRLISTMQYRNHSNFNKFDEFIKSSNKTLKHYNAYHSLTQSNYLYKNVENKTLEVLGIDSYIWRTAGDEYVRDSHAIRNYCLFDLSGKRLDGPQPDEKYINTGEEPGCRCWKFVEDIRIKKGVLNAKV